MWYVVRRGTDKNLRLKQTEYEKDNRQRYLNKQWIIPRGFNQKHTQYQDQDEFNLHPGFGIILKICSCQTMRRNTARDEKMRPSIHMHEKIKLLYDSYTFCRPLLHTNSLGDSVIFCYNNESVHLN